MNTLVTKLSAVKKAAESGDWCQAIILAAKFQDLGEQRNAILQAREAINRPDFQRQINRNPDALIAAGIEALKLRYKL